MATSRLSFKRVCQLVVITMCLGFSVLTIRNTLTTGNTLFIERLPTKLPVRRGMTMEQVRKIMGEPDSVATLEEPNGNPREDWWYSNPYTVQLTFINGQLTSDHSKALGG
jgi:outer membrane protein assembly factor BamE (lipoprotein component of BamABCDE complex)